MNNLIISYDLNNPGQNYDSVIDCIKSLGSWAKIHKSVWYIKSALTAAEAKNKLVSVIDKNDTVFVVDATHDAAAWFNLSDKVSNFLIEKWNSSVRSTRLG